MKDSSKQGKSPMIIAGAVWIITITGALVGTVLAGVVRLYWEGLKLGWSWGGFFQ